MMESGTFMIVQRTESNLLLITQPDHAALAGRIMREWTTGLLDSSRRDDILRAVEEHDNGWREVDRGPILDASGRILDFVTAPDDVRQGVWPRAIERLAGFPYTAALVAQHAAYVYSRYRSRPEWTAFFTDMDARRDEHLARLPGASLDELLCDYEAVRLGDLISLVFCNAWTDPQAHGRYEIRLDGDDVVVTPDPFAARSVVIDIEARELPNHPFASAADARRAFDTAPRRTLSGRIRGR